MNRDTPGPFVLVITTAGSEEEATRIGWALVERGIAACVNVISKVRSIYRWQGEVTEDAEKLLFVKTAERLLPEVRDAIREMHGYEVPEVIAVPITDGDPPYLDWLSSSLKRD